MEEMAKEVENVGIKKNNNHDQILVKEDDQGENINGGKKMMNDQQRTSLRTPADVYEHPSFYSFIIDMPGLDAQNIKVKVENRILHVSGKKKKKQIIGEPTTTIITGNEGVRAIRLERRRARYMRKFNLAADANCEDVKAAYHEGVLSIVVAKNNKKLSSTLDVEVEDQSKLNSLSSVSIS